MTQETLDVVGIGNAIVDVIAPCDDAFLTKHDLPKGGMKLIDEGEAEALYGAMPPGQESSGGSAANTIAGIAALGGKCGFIAKVRDDQLGKVFRHDMTALGVRFPTAAANDGPATARCLILVTPDAQRTMNTYLGASQHLGPDDVEEELIAAAKITYLEGYLWDPAEAKAAFRKAASLAHKHGRKVALSLSDSFCVDRHRADFLDLIAGEVDILFANEAEITSLYEVDDFDTALQLVRGHTKIAALTRSEKGSVVLSGDELHVVDADKVTKLVDSTGAGDLYAAGFLYGLGKGEALVDCGRRGAIAAGEVISHFGARPEADLKRLMAAKLG
jgi:sugar/nucleoside kinase (ribokinase family)